MIPWYWLIPVLLFGIILGNYLTFKGIKYQTDKGTVPDALKDLGLTLKK
jgi:hypothetical protein